MTEINDINEKAEKSTEDPLPEAVERFILYWGDLGGQWGVNRSVAQIHALLYLSPKPLNAERIAETLRIARSNVSNSLKELTGWKLIRRVPIPGDRRDHFEAETDLWEMVARIAQGRKEREIDPAAAALRECVTSASTDPKVDPVALARLQEMLRFVEAINRWYEQMLRVPKAQLSTLMKMGDKVVSVLSLGKKAKNQSAKD
ncbi:MAG: MarR family transcriptional regulator [Alphaproteobacteria bacterium]|nr:MarR family transcriptional regulator [Alphaproteobacteria bacterium]